MLAPHDLTRFSSAVLPPSAIILIRPNSGAECDINRVLVEACAKSRRPRRACRDLRIPSIFSRIRTIFARKHTRFDPLPAPPARKTSTLTRFGVVSDYGIDHTRADTAAAGASINSAGRWDQRRRKVEQRFASDIGPNRDMRSSLFQRNAATAAFDIGIGQPQLPAIA